MGCYRCIVVVPHEEQDEAIGVCLRCGSMACRRDGSLDRDYPQFICGMCEIDRLFRSGGLPPEPPDPPPRGGGGLLAGGEPDRPRDPFGGSGVYVDTDDFERHKPELADHSYAHRREKREEIDEMVEDLVALGTDDRARAVMAQHLGDDFDTEELHQTAMLLSNQLLAARDMEELKPDLLADAFGLATWAIGAEPDREPEVTQLRHLHDRRLRVALGRSPIKERA